MSPQKVCLQKRNIRQAVVIASKDRISIASPTKSEMTAQFGNKITITFIQ